MSKYDKYNKEIKKLHEQGKTNAEISKELNLDSRRLSDQLKKLGLKRNEKIYNETPTKLQHEVFISLVIGDGSIYKTKGNKNYRMNLAHSLKQREYFLEKYNILKSFIDVEYREESQVHNKSKKEYFYLKFQTRVNPYYTKLHDRFYRGKKKIIPGDLIEDITPRILAYKYFDDGYKMRKAYYISMDDYDKRSVYNFQKILLDKFGISTTLHDKGKKIYIPTKDALKFKNIISEFATNDLLYKL